MTLVDWLSTREPSPPPRLAARLRELVSRGDPDRGIAPVVLIESSGDVLRRLLGDGQTARGSALELLAADALATYAFEAEGETPDTLDERCAWAMRYFSEIADST